MSNHEYIKGQISVKLNSEEARSAFLKKMERMLSVAEIIQTSPDQRGNWRATLYILHVNPRYTGRVLESLEKSPLVEFAERISARYPAA